MEMKNSPGKHQRSGSYIVIFSEIRAPGKRTPNPPPEAKEKKKKVVLDRKRGGAGRWEADAVEIGKRRSFLKEDRWDNAGGSRFVGPECDDTAKAAGKRLRASLFNRWWHRSNRFPEQKQSQNDRREGGCRIKAMKSRSEPAKRAKGIWPARQGRRRSAAEGWPGRSGLKQQRDIAREKGEGAAGRGCRGREAGFAGADIVEVISVLKGPGAINNRKGKCPGEWDRLRRYSRTVKETTLA